MKKIIKRSQKVLFKHINNVFFVYSGKVFKSVTVTKDIVNYRFGDFVLTRTVGIKTKKK